jgi:D-alanyl-D-alanine carboxypeptidase
MRITRSATTGGLALLFLVATCEPAIATDLLNSCPPLAPAPSPAGSLGETVDNLVALEMQRQGLPSMTVEISKHGVPLYARSYGYADLTSCRPARIETPYQIGSVTKQFTAAAILQLQHAGVLNIDSPVLTYLSGYAFDPRITLRMLLNHTSGLVNYLSFQPPPGWLNGLPENTILTAIAQQPLQFTPGSAYQYSNSNYFILGAVIEAVTSLSYWEYLERHILRRADLTHTGPEQSPLAASPYTYTNPAVPGTTGLAEGIIPDPSIYFSAGALWSTVADLAKWDAALRDGAIVSREAFDEMITPPPSTPTYQDAGVPSTYAMGWVASSPGAVVPVIWHNGQTLAYTAFNSLELENGFSVAVLTNVDIQTNTPLYPFSVTLINAVCTSSTGARICGGDKHD